MGENEKESNFSGDRKPTNVNKTQKSRLVKDGSVVESGDVSAASSASTSQTTSTARSAGNGKVAGKKLAGSRPVSGNKKSKFGQKFGSAKTTSATSSSSSFSTSEVNYAAYNGEAGIARFFWWALASLAFIIALGLIATQCLGSSDTGSSVSNSSSQVADSPTGNAVSSSGQTASDASTNDSDPDGPVSEREATSLTALAAAGLINVDTVIDGDTATLNGAVGSEADRIKAEETVAEIEGIETVVNNLVVDEDLEPTSVVSDDAATAEDKQQATTPTSLPEPSETPAAEPEPAEPSYNG